MKILKKKQTHEYYVLEKNGKFFQDFGDENNYPIMCEYPDDAYTFGKRSDLAKSFLVEYSERFKGFKVMQITETITQTYKCKDTI